MVMRRYENDSPLEGFQFEKTKLWVQVHGIPIKYMTIEVVKKICSVLGEVSAPKDPKIYDGGHFIRVQISIDLSLPLCRGRLISVGEGGKQVWISFKYERLPNLCYWCGRLTHDNRDYELWIDSEGTLKLEQHEFEPQLRAPPFVAARKNAIMVPCYYAAKKKEGSGASTDHGSGRSSVSGKGKLSEQSQGVTVSTTDNIDGDNISSLMHNKMNGNRKEDLGLKAKVDEEIMEESNKLNESVFDLEITVELNKNNVTVTDVEANDEEVCLAKEIGAAKLLGSGKSATKNPTSRYNLSHLSQLKKSRDSL